MNILFRVDAGGEIGLGHFYRSVNLAKKLMIRAHKVFFVHKKSSFWSGINSQFIHIDVDSEEDQLKLIEELNIDIFYVDSILNFTKDFVQKVNKVYNCKIIFYQNISNSRYLCDYFILPSIHQKAAFFQDFRKKTKIFQGLEYFTFNEKLETISPKENIANTLSNVAIVSGGSDPKDILGKLYRILKKYGQEKLNYNYFYGNNYLFKNQLPKDSELHKFQPFDLNEIVKNDIVITSFGVSAYEFMALKIPVIAIGHQSQNANASDYLAKEGYLFSLGNIDELQEEIFFKEFDKIINNPGLRREVVQKASKKIDLKGIKRIINIIENE